MSETHAFVTVEGSGATVIIGFILYLSTLLFSVYTTWGEFTEIISRMNEAESRLGYKAVAASKNLSVQWRETDSLLHDALHPKVDKETALAADVELTRPNGGERKLKKPPGRDREFEGAWSAYTVLESPVPGPGAV